MKSCCVKLVVHMSWTRYLFRGDIYERFWYINRKIELVKEKVLGFINANSEMFWSHCGIIQDEINWILFFCWWHLVFLRLAWKFVWSLSCETRKKLAKHLLTGTFLGDSIYFRIKLILAFYGIKHGKNWQWHPLWNLFLDNLNLFFASILLRIKHGKNWQNCT